MVGNSDCRYHYLRSGTVGYCFGVNLCIDCYLDWHFDYCCCCGGGWCFDCDLSGTVGFGCRFVLCPNRFVCFSWFLVGFAGCADPNCIGCKENPLDNFYIDLENNFGSCFALCVGLKQLAHGGLLLVEPAH